MKKVIILTNYTAENILKHQFSWLAMKDQKQNNEGANEEIYLAVLLVLASLIRF